MKTVITRWYLGLIPLQANVKQYGVGALGVTKVHRVSVRVTRHGQWRTLVRARNTRAYALSPAGPVYAGPGASPTQATAEPFTADSPYFPFNARPGSRLSPAKAKIIPAGLRVTKDEPPGTATALDAQWGVDVPSDLARPVYLNNLDVQRISKTFVSLSYGFVLKTGQSGFFDRVELGPSVLSISIYKLKEKKPSLKD
ncbi:hypothetical protein NQ318_005373 [Aromia moschata]|uniref:Uncharacterized protein n=1 Tax=Aromia moschata TaxID=1265417 RepID=A0AAV8YYH6_9CUCU|nr:hypothetical protein NQ318_005373 [Aromia moschata]